LFSSPKLTLKTPLAENVLISAEVQSIRYKNSSSQYLVLEELKKVTEEIKQRLGNIDTWFHYKFVLLGGVLLALITRLSKAIDLAYCIPFLGTGMLHAPCETGKDEVGTSVANIRREQTSEDNELQALLESKAANVVLGLGCVIEFISNMHINSHCDGVLRVVSQQMK
jgi:hypothetical protein